MTEADGISVDLFRDMWEEGLKALANMINNIHGRDCNDDFLNVTIIPLKKK